MSGTYRFDTDQFSSFEPILIPILILCFAIIEMVFLAESHFCRSFISTIGFGKTLRWFKFDHQKYIFHFGQIGFASVYRKAILDERQI